MRQNPALEYRHEAVRNASPMGLLVLLYDSAINSLNRAIRAMASGNGAPDIELRVNSLNHVLSILGHFQQTLDFEKGGEVAKNLDRFYAAARSMIMEASITQSQPILLDLAAQMQGQRDAWKEADLKDRMPPPQAIADNAGGATWSA